MQSIFFIIVCDLCLIRFNVSKHHTVTPHGKQIGFTLCYVFLLLFWIIECYVIRLGNMCLKNHRCIATERIFPLSKYVKESDSRSY
jgi:hypothetical protein